MELNSAEIQALKRMGARLLRLAWKLEGGIIARAPRTRELVLEALRRRGHATVAELAAELGMPSGRVKATLIRAKPQVVSDAVPGGRGREATWRAGTR